MNEGEQQVACNACGARNRPEWDFCVRCGEALDGVLATLVVAPTEPEPKTPHPRVDASAQRSGPSWGMLLAVAAAALLAGLSLRIEPIRPLPANTFVFPTLAAQPAEPPTRTPLPSGWEEFRRGQGLLRAGRATEALPLLKMAADLNPDHAPMQFAYAVALWATGDQQASLGVFERVVGLDADNVAYRTEYGDALEQAGKSSAAVEQYEAALTLQPTSSATVEALAAVHLRGGRASQAVPLLRRLVELRGDNPLALTNLAFALEESGDAAGALEGYRQVVERHPNITTARARMAELLFNQGRERESVQLIREGLNENPAAPLLHRSLGSLLERTGDHAGAARAYREYARLAPGAADAKEVAARADGLKPEAHRGS